ncbi:MAG: S8 family serine peptidase [Verrucomicrobiales bacterium]|nr:S8 family serine peptidase [Verrucomicrobiales bacterium]MCP5557635.1 S8 family serine peptidase [Verrucomicrobiaceae bacterium]
MNNIMTPPIDDQFLATAKTAMQQSRGAGVRIAILDSGVDTTHPALAGIQLADDVALVREGDFLTALPGNGDVIGHGTAIAWLIRSLAPEAEIGSFRVLDGDLRSRATVVWEAARLAMQRGYHILNCSFGSPGEPRLVMPYKEWTDEAYLKRVHIVAACNNEDAGFREWPGWFPTVVTVNLANMDPEIWTRRAGSLVEFAAHGHDVLVPWQGGWKKVTGSSFAAPRLTGWLARLLSAHPDLSVEAAREILRRLAHDESSRV